MLEGKSMPSTMAANTNLSPVSLSVFSLAPDLLFNCSRELEYAKIRTVLQSRTLERPFAVSVRFSVVRYSVIEWVRRWTLSLKRRWRCMLFIYIYIYLFIYINDSGHKKVSFVRINQVSILNGLISVKIYELFRREKRNCLLYLVTYQCQ